MGTLILWCERQRKLNKPTFEKKIMVTKLRISYHFRLSVDSPSSRWASLRNRLRCSGGSSSRRRHSGGTRESLTRRERAKPVRDVCPSRYSRSLSFIVVVSIWDSLCLFLCSARSLSLLCISLSPPLSCSALSLRSVPLWLSLCFRRVSPFHLLPLLQHYVVLLLFSYQKRVLHSSLPPNWHTIASARQ